jgi:hypothetical protein
MQLRLNKPWEELVPERVAKATGALGVYQIADSGGRVLVIGYAGGRSLFGLRGEVDAELKRRGPGHRFRLEVNMQYMTRWQELLMLHQADHGDLPPGNAEFRQRRLGRLGPWDQKATGQAKS